MLEVTTSKPVVYNSTFYIFEQSAWRGAQILVKKLCPHEKYDKNNSYIKYHQQYFDNAFVFTNKNFTFLLDNTCLSDLSYITMSHSWFHSYTDIHGWPPELSLLDERHCCIYCSVVIDIRRWLPNYLYPMNDIESVT